MGITLDVAANVGGGQVHVVGSHNGRAVLQVLNLNTQSVGAVQFFDSLAGAANMSGKIRSVGKTDSGQILYVGDSAGSFDKSQPTS